MTEKACYISWIGIHFYLFFLSFITWIYIKLYDRYIMSFIWLRRLLNRCYEMELSIVSLVSFYQTFASIESSDIQPTQ